MATTTNYSWETPDDTDLVKDGAAAIRTLGSSIDTTTKALNPSTTLGDIEYRSSTANTNTRLAVGSTGQVLTVAGGVPSWATPTSSAPSYSLINAGGTALTGATTITISGISGKNQLFVTIIGCSSATGNSNFSIRLNSDSGSNYGYFNAIMIAPDSVTEDSAATTSLMYIGAISANAGSVLSGYCLVDGCNSSGVKVMHHSTGSTNATGGNAQLNTGGGTWSGSATVSSISIISSAGNFDNGTIYVYGA